MQSVYKNKQGHTSQTQKLHELRKKKSKQEIMERYKATTKMPLTCKWMGTLIFGVSMQMFYRFHNIFEKHKYERSRIKFKTTSHDSV